MIEEQKITKHIGEQKPLNQNPQSSDSNQGSSNGGNSGNPIKPQETQKNINLNKRNFLTQSKERK